MTNKEKIIELVSDEETNTIGRAKERIERNIEQNIPKSGINRSEKLKGCACYGSNALHPCFCK